MSKTGANLAATIVANALERGFGDRTAIREGDRALSYSQLADLVLRVATAYRTLRIARGERIAVFMPDSLEAVTAILGAIYRGAVAVPISELGRANDVRNMLLDSGAAAVVVHSDLEPVIDSIRSEVPDLREVIVVGERGPGQRDFVSLVRGAARASEGAGVEGSDPALIFYSAGASQPQTGVPAKLRGVAHSHQTPLRSFAAINSSLMSLTENDRVFSVVRLSTTYGFGAGLLFPLAAGAEAVLLSGKPRSSAIFEVFEKHPPTVFVATPSRYGQLSRDADKATIEHPMAKLRLALSGGEDLPTSVFERVRDLLGVEVTVGYGLTEAFQFVVAGPAGSGRPGACGTPVAGLELRIVDDDGVPVGVDEIGTLEIRGPSVASAYWGDDESTIDGDGWFKTRDRFMFDSSRNYYHCGRVDHLFKVGGKWVAPDEVERALMANEKVWECAVIGADDEDGFVKPLAFVVPNIGHDPGPSLEEELRSYVKAELAPYKYPRWIEFVDELPKGPSGTVLRFKLRDRVIDSPRARRAETVTD